MAQEPAERRPARVVVAVVMTLSASVFLALFSWIPGYRSLFRGLPEIAWWMENAVRPLIPVVLGLLFVYGARPARWARELGMNRPVGSPFSNRCLGLLCPSLCICLSREGL